MLLLTVSGPGWASGAVDVSNQTSPIDSTALTTPSDTLGIEQAAPVVAPPDGTKQPQDGQQAGAADSVRAPAVFLPVPADSSAPGDTLNFIAPVPSGGVPAGKPGTSPELTPPKERTGLLGIHPIAILLGLVVLHVFIINLVGG